MGELWNLVKNYLSYSLLIDELKLNCVGCGLISLNISCFEDKLCFCPQKCSEVQSWLITLGEDVSSFLDVRKAIFLMSYIRGQVLLISQNFVAMGVYMYVPSNESSSRNSWNHIYHNLHL